MKRILLGALVSVLASSVAAGAPPELFDQGFKEAVELRDKAAWGECKDVSNMSKKFSCIQEVKEAFEAETKSVRGTHAYELKHYRGLDESTLLSGIKKRKELMKLAEEHRVFDMNREKGAVTKELLNSELVFLRKELAAIHAKTRPSLADKAEKMGLPGMAAEIKKLTSQPTE